MSSDRDSQYEEFYRYTGGRWLWGEEKELRDRYKVFNVPELQRLAAESVGAKSCSTMTKMLEGSFNKVFRLVMCNGAIAIARIPYRNVWPKFYTTASEVATMEFVRTVLNIPIPRVFAWSANVNNTVGAEYIIMEEATGTPIASSWETYDIRSRIAIMEDLVSIEKRLLSVSFMKYGNLYFASDDIPDSSPAEIVGEVSPEVKNEVYSRFTIGPVTEAGFWKGERSQMNINRGPWERPQDYMAAMAQREIAWIHQFALPKQTGNPVKADSPESHISMLRKYLSLVPYLLPADDEITRSNLYHTDLHSGNLFVDSNRITSVIDWQSMWAGPLFLEAREPRLVRYDGEMMLKNPDNFKALNEDEKDRVKRQMARSIVLHLYRLCTAEENPRLMKAIKLIHGDLRKQTVAFAGDCWDADILKLRQCLIRVERYWNDLGANEACPIHFTEDDIANHLEDAKGYNEFEDFWDSVAHIVDRDGWTQNENYQDAVAFFEEIKKEGFDFDFEAYKREKAGW